jgi:hypothetical protein
LLLLSIGIIFSTIGVPYVIVPVLSNTITSVLPSCSIAAPLFTIIFCFAALFIPLIIATGVANMRGQGVATTSIESIV